MQGSVTDEKPGSDDPTVSVVVPTYESASVVSGAIDSAFDQSHRPDEVVVVDGGSSDGTRDVLDGVGDERLHVVGRDRPAGPGAARNVGVEESEGEYVAFLDADDRWRPSKLARQLAALDRADASVSLTGIEKPAGEPRTRDGAEGNVHEAIKRLDVPTYTSTLLASRTALAEVEGFDESLRCFEDWELCLRLSRNYRFAFVDDPLVVKGTGEDNVSADPDRLASAFERLDRRYALPRCARAQFLADVGLTHFESGRFAAGRPYVVRSLELEPRQPKAAIALALSLTRSRETYATAMGGVYGAERLLVAGLAYAGRCRR